MDSITMVSCPSNELSSTGSYVTQAQNLVCFQRTQPSWAQRDDYDQLLRNPLMYLFILDVARSIALTCVM